MIKVGQIRLSNRISKLLGTRDFDTSFYILIATIAISGERVFAGGRQAFWFESQQVKTGDNVVVYTRAGAYSKVARPDGHFNHFFYWGMSQTLFGDPLARVVVAELN